MRGFSPFFMSFPFIPSKNEQDEGQLLGIQDDYVVNFNLIIGPRSPLYYKVFRLEVPLCLT